MQQYTIEEQIEAFQFLIEYEALGIPPKIFKKIKAKAAKEWDKDYAMQQYIIEEQVEAYLSVHPPEESPAGCPM